MKNINIYIIKMTDNVVNMTEKLNSFNNDMERLQILMDRKRQVMRKRMEEGDYTSDAKYDDPNFYLTEDEKKTESSDEGKNKQTINPFKLDELNDDGLNVADLDKDKLINQNEDKILNLNEDVNHLNLNEDVNVLSEEVNHLTEEEKIALMEQIKFNMEENEKCRMELLSQYESMKKVLESL